MCLKKMHCRGRRKNRYSVSVLVRLGINIIFNYFLTKLFLGLSFVLFINRVKFYFLGMGVLSLFQDILYRTLIVQNWKSQKRKNKGQEIARDRSKGEIFTLCSMSDVLVYLSLPCGCIIFIGVYSKSIKFSVVKEHEYGIHDKAILFTNKPSFVYKYILQS